MNGKNGRSGVWLAVLVLAIIFGMSVFAPWIAPCDPTEIDMSNALAQPSKDHWLGTDNVGRDLLSRVIYGGRESIVLAMAATALSMLLGAVLGMLAGYYGGAVDLVIISISNIFQGIPGTTMMIAIAGLAGPGVRSMLLALVITSWVGFSRIVRGETMRLKQETFIEGIRGFGAGDLRIMLVHIAPNIISSVLIIFASRTASAVLSVASLSFLGLGLQPPTPDWGVMINDARMYFRSNPVLVLAPGACIMALSLSVNTLADALRDYFDVYRQVQEPG